MLMFTIRSVQAEFLKLRRSLVLYIALSIPLFPAFANVADTLKTGLSVAFMEEAKLAPWSLFFRSSYKLWTIFALPMIVALIGAFLAYSDHKSKSWKILFVLPLPRETIFAGKWFTLAGLVLLSNMIFTLANLTGGLLVNLVKPGIGLGLSIPFGEMIFSTLVSWLLSLLMVSIHLWISLHWSSFLVSITVGFAATVSNLFLIFSYLIGRSVISPWAMPAQVYGDWMGSLPAALIGAILVALLAMWDFVGRDVI
jgi:lantibiotic transport system permease protein